MAAALFAVATADRTAAEQTQRGTLVSSLKGELRPLALPRHHPAPIAIHLEGRLRTTDGSLLPRVTRLEIGLPAQGILSTRGLATCPPRRIRNMNTAEALSACRPALIGQGQLGAVVTLPNQAPFRIGARLLAFNARIGGRHAVLLHAGAANPPTSSVLPLLIEPGSGRFGTALVGRIAPALGPWPHFERFRLTLFRRYRVAGGALRSYLSASCPLSNAQTAGFFSLARASYVLAGGSRIETTTAGGCRAR
jgi:hypothetical protein